jgi:hypothetical protein
MTQEVKAAPSRAVGPASVGVGGFSWQRDRTRHRFARSPSPRRTRSFIKI